MGFHIHLYLSLCFASMKLERYFCDDFFDEFFWRFFWRILGPSDDWSMRQSTQRPSVLYWRLSDFRFILVRFLVFLARTIYTRLCFLHRIDSTRFWERQFSTVSFKSKIIAIEAGNSSTYWLIQSWYLNFVKV